MSLDDIDSREQLVVDSAPLNIRSDWMVFWRDRRLGNMLDQIEKKRGSSALNVVRLGREVQDRLVKL